MLVIVIVHPSRSQPPAVTMYLHRHTGITRHPARTRALAEARREGHVLIWLKLSSVSACTAVTVVGTRRFPEDASLIFQIPAECYLCQTVVVVARRISICFDVLSQTRVYIYEGT